MCLLDVQFSQAKLDASRLPSSCTEPLPVPLQGQRQEPQGAPPRPSAPTYLPTYLGWRCNV